jgi:hypothetical protein
MLRRLGRWRPSKNRPVGLGNRNLHVTLGDLAIRQTCAKVSHPGIHGKACSHMATGMATHAVGHDGDAEILVTKDAILVTPPDLPHVGFHHHPPETHLLPSVPKTLWPKNAPGACPQCSPPAKRLKTHYRPSAG